MPWWMKRVLMNEETGGEFSSGGGASDAGAVAGTESTGPSSMLEAITEGLNTQDQNGAGNEGSEQYNRDGQGRFAKKDGDSADRGDGKNLNNELDPVTGQDKPNSVDQKAQQPSKQEDELAMPEGLSPKAQERFQALASKVKESQSVLQQVQNDMNGFRQIMQEAKASPQELVTALDYIKAVNSGDLQSALDMLDMQRRQISLAMGKPLPGADPLSDFPDLRQRVDTYQMDEQSAIEMARHRAMQQQMQQRQQMQMQSQRQHQETVQTRQRAIQSIDQMGAQWAKTDPDFAAKEEVILKQIPIIAQKFPPSMWASQVEILYQTLSSMPAQAPRTAQPAPLRPSGQSAGARQPTSMLEALNVGLGYGN